MKKLIPFLLGLLAGLVFVKSAFAYKVQVTYTITTPSGSYKSLSKTKPQAKRAPRVATETHTFLSTSDRTTAPLTRAVPPQGSEEATESIKKYFGKEWRLAWAIAKAESGLVCSKDSYQPNSDGSMDHGLFQINDVHMSKLLEGESLWDCDTNARIAKQIRDSWEGYHAWSAYNNGNYLVFYNQ